MCIERKEKNFFSDRKIKNSFSSVKIHFFDNKEHMPYPIVHLPMILQVVSLYHQTDTIHRRSYFYNRQYNDHQKGYQCDFLKQILMFFLR